MGSSRYRLSDKIDMKEKRRFSQLTSSAAHEEVMRGRVLSRVQREKDAQDFDRQREIDRRRALGLPPLQEGGELTAKR